MTKISITLYYWILVIATLIFAKTIGIADSNSVMIKILIVVSIIYAGVVIFGYTRGKATTESQRNGQYRAKGKIKGGSPSNNRKGKKK